ncbi:MAG: penicillin-binding protein [Oscillospiraceae bacterium]|nr:penicillin-binding protein [Oscillospiraceae bacterium]
MKKVRRRTWFTVILALALIAGMGLLLFRYIVNGRKWAGFSGNQSVYTSGTISQGGIYDRNGVLLYDAESGAYNDDATIRKATLHVVGDQAGMIATSALQKFSGYLSGFNLVTGTTAGGSDLYLTIDAEINAVAYEAMGSYKGTVAVYNYETGEILCLVSTPTYDPENVPTISDDDETYEGVYLNRFYSSTYTPGSTFKIVTLAAAIENDSTLFTDTYDCSGSVTINGNSVTCTSAHGSGLTIAEAFADSCNVTFGQLAVSLGGSTIASYAEQAGLTANHSVNGITTAAGSFTQGSDDNSVAWSGIGQYEDLVNPCAMLRLMGAIANGGVPVEPRILKSQKNELTGLTTTAFSAETGDRIWSASTCETLKTLMRNNVVTNYGQDRFGSLTVCAKSGTAETGSDANTTWFVGFVDDEDYPYAFVVVCEDSGGYGSSVAGTVAATVLNALVAADAS